jgi:SAM-dependent methyltransferase
LLYDFAIVPLTAGWYRAVLTRLPPRCRLLDVGIGTGSALFANADLIVAKEIQVVGIDVNAAYVESCRRGAARHGLDTRVVAQLESVYDHRGGPYDAAYFSGSFMLLPDPPGALRHVGSLLAPGGCIYFTQTFEHRRSRVVETCKPLLRFLTTIDFGRVTYEHEFRRALEQGNTDLEAVHTLRASRRRSSVLVVARAAAG